MARICRRSGTGDGPRRNERAVARTETRHPPAEVKTFGTREKALKTASFERRRDGAILQNGAYDSGGDDPRVVSEPPVKNQPCLARRYDLPSHPRRNIDSAPSPNCRRHHLHLPDASADTPGRTWQLPHMRNDAGAGQSDGGGGRKP